MKKPNSPKAAGHHQSKPTGSTGSRSEGSTHRFRKTESGTMMRTELLRFSGAVERDPTRLLQGNGKSMRHVKLRPGTVTNAAALSRLIDTAYSDIKARVENG